MRELNTIFIHCTATPAGREYTTQQIEGWFKALGWDNPGYHYVIHLDGRVEQLLGVNYIANGVKGMNAHSIHIAYLGGTINGKPADTRTTAQKIALVRLVDKLRADYASGCWGNPPCSLKEATERLRLRGHNEVSAKACPCFNVSEGQVPDTNCSVL